MAAVSAERDMAKMFGAAESCSVCLDAVSDLGERSIAKLKCGHHFHLDCIGSAFNAKGAMQCPNCRHVENGQWLYSSGSRVHDEFSIDGNASRLMFDEFSIDTGIRFEEFSYEDYPNEVYPAFPAFLITEEPLNHFDWCPYEPGSLSAGGSSYEQVHFSVPLRHEDGPVRMLPEVVLNVSYNYNESGGAGSSPPVCPYLEAQARQSRGTEESRLRPPAAGRPSRPFDLSSASNSASVGSSIGNGDVFNSRINIWGPRLQSGYGYLYGEQPTSSHVGDCPFLPRPTVHDPETPNSWSGPSAPERPPNSWFRTEPGRLSSQYDTTLGTYSAQPNHTELFSDGGSLPSGPGLRSRFAHGQVGTSQSQPQLQPQPQPQGSSIRSAGSNRRARQNGMSSTSIAGGRTDGGHSAGELSRRFSHSWTDLSLSLGPEPPVSRLGSHGPGHQSRGQSSVPYRRDSTEPFTSVWTPGELWHPPARPPSGLTPTLSNFRHSDFIEGHGSSLAGSATRAELDLDQYQTSLSPSFGQDAAAAGSSLPHRIHLPTSLSIPPPKMAGWL